MFFYVNVDNLFKYKSHFVSEAVFIFLDKSSDL